MIQQPFLSCQANRYLHSIAFFLDYKTHCTRYGTVAPTTTTNIYKNTFKSSNAFRIHKWFSMAIANIWYSHRKIYTFVTMVYPINDDIFAICVSFISVLFFYRYSSLLRPGGHFGAMYSFILNIIIVTIVYHTRWWHAVWSIRLHNIEYWSQSNWLISIKEKHLFCRWLVVLLDDFAW